MSNPPSRVWSAVLEILEASGEFTAEQRSALATAIETGIETFRDELLERTAQLKREADKDSSNSHIRRSD